MASSATLEALDALIARLKESDWKSRDAVKAELLAVASAEPDRAGVEEHLAEAKKSLALELRWEIDEVVEDLQPPPEPEPEEEPEEEAPPDDGRLKASDLQLLYDDPRGIRVHKTKKGPDRWFLTQMDPYTGQPRMMELHPQEIEQLKQELAGSPYWVLGSGEAV